MSAGPCARFLHWGHRPWSQVLLTQMLVLKLLSWLNMWKVTLKIAIVHDLIKLNCPYSVCFLLFLILHSPLCHVRQRGILFFFLQTFTVSSSHNALEKKQQITTKKNMNMVSSRRARTHFIMHFCYSILRRYSSLTSSSITLSTVHPWSDRLCVGCLEPVWLPATGEPEDHPWN